MSPTPEARRDRRILLTVATVAVCISLAGSVTSFYANHERALENMRLALGACNNANGVRQQLRSYFDFLITTTAGSKLPQARKAAIKKFYITSKKRFQDQPC